MSIWNKVRANIRAGIEWAFSSSENPKKTSTVVKKKAEPKTVTKRVRARTAKGRYKGDDKSTPDVNEAWEGGKAPKKKATKKKTTKKKGKAKKK